MFYGGFLYYVNNFVSVTADESKVNVKNIQTVDIKQKIEKISQNKAFRYIQDILVKSGIEDSLLAVQNQRLSLEFEASYDKSFELLYILENHFRIFSFSLSSKNGLLITEILLDTRYLFNANQAVKKDLQRFNPFYDKTIKVTPEVKIEKKEESFQVPAFQIDAILGDEILIDQQWYQAGESIQGNTIIQIQKDRVILKNSTNQKNFYIKYNNK